MRSSIFWLSVLTPFLLISCASDDEINTLDDVSNSENVEGVNLSEKLGLEEGDVKMFTMPTPVQVATALNVLGVDYNESLLLENGKYNLTSNTQLSLNLGMYLTDLGYTVIYNNSQKSLNYSKDVQTIMEKLPIPTYLNDGFKSRFKTNIENRDSLTKIILEGYNEANQHVTKTQDEGLGLLILTGAYIEGLYLISSSDVPEQWIQEHNNIFIQQKLFLDNFITLLNGFSDRQEINTIINNLEQLQMAFNKIAIKFDDQSESYKLTQPISNETKTEIKTLISEIRDTALAD